MFGMRNNLLSGRSCDAMATEPKIHCFVYLFYSFVTGWILEILYLHIRAALGHSQNNQTITTLTPVPALQHQIDQELKQDKSVAALTHHIARLGLALWWALGSCLPGFPYWQERCPKTLWLGVPQAVNNETKWQVLFLLQKWAIFNFVACLCSEGFYCFPKKRFYCTSQIT